MFDYTDYIERTVPPASPRWMQPLVDFTVDSTSYAWYKLVVDGRGLEPCGVSQLNEPPEWEKESDESFHDMVPFECGDYARVVWALENGLAPGQPFLVKIEPPHYYSSETDCGTEYDVDYEWDIVWKLETRRDHAKAWEIALRRIQQHIAAVERYRQRKYEYAVRSYRRWKLDTQHFGGFGYNSPEIVRVQLVAELPHYGHYQLGSGRSEKNNWDEAFWNMAHRVEEVHPAIDMQKVISLADGRAKPTWMDRLRYGTSP